MEPVSQETTKYQKLATEYSKIRAQANVLKRAVLEEQNKSSCLRETVRLKESSLRRAEQEVDSLGFRNKQLEHRVASLQEDLEHELKRNKNSKGNSKSKINNELAAATDTVVAEELQKKILENAQLASLIADKKAELEIFSDRIHELEKQITKHISDHTDIERKLRREIDILCAKNADLETKLVEASSTIGSEDGLSVTGSDHTPLHTSSSSNEERIAYLEKEVNHWRTQYEILKIGDIFVGPEKSDDNTLLMNGPNGNGNRTASEGSCSDNSVTKEQLIYNHFSKKIEELFTAKCMAESKLATYKLECESLQNTLELLSLDIKAKEQTYRESQLKLQMSEDDLTTTRINYEEQICVLTEQVISLSDQLAASK